MNMLHATELLDQIEQLIGRTWATQNTRELLWATEDGAAFDAAAAAAFLDWLDCERTATVTTPLRWHTATALYRLVNALLAPFCPPPAFPVDWLADTACSITCLGKIVRGEPLHAESTIRRGG